MGISPRDLRRSMSGRKVPNHTSIVETAIPPKSQKSGAILMEKLDQQLEISKECERRLEEYGDTLQGMDRMLLEYDNQLMECQMQLSKYDNQLVESQKMLADCSSRLIDEVPRSVLTQGMLDQYDGVLAEYKNAVDKYYALVDQYQEQINKIMGTEEDRMAGVQMALDLTYIKEELDELKNFMGQIVKQNQEEEEQPEAEEDIEDDSEEPELMVEKFFDELDQTALKRHEEQCRMIENKFHHCVEMVQDIVYTHNQYIDERFKKLDSQFKNIDARREEGILKQNQTLTEKLLAQNHILDDKLEELGEAYAQTLDEKFEGLNGAYAQILEEKLLVQSKTMVDKLQVQNHFLEEEIENQNQFIEDSLASQNQHIDGRMSMQNKAFEEIILRQSQRVEDLVSKQNQQMEESLKKNGQRISEKIESLLSKPESGEEEEDPIITLLKENQAKLNMDKEEIVKKILALEGVVKDEKGQVSTAKSELTVLIDRTAGATERKVGKLSKFTMISFILNLISLLGIAAMLLQMYGS